MPDARVRIGKLARCTVALVLCVVPGATARAAGAQAALRFEERVACRAKVEDVYWAHRIWPRENPGPKPRRPAVLPDEEIARQVDESLRYETALETIWQAGLTPQAIQAELDRMVAHSKQPEVLEEIVSALGHDPTQVAECLVRPELALRRIEERYAGGGELHSGARQPPPPPFAAWWSAVGRGMDRADPSPALYTWSTPPGGAPAADGWTPIPASFVPDPRRGHSAVWTGSEMIVWGGANGFAVINAGRYSPSTDSWVPASTTNAPTADFANTAVWTGREMIVWGGVDTSGYVRTGGRYDPLSDRWVPTATRHAPAGRVGHTAVWTGREMVVWGGFPNQGGYLDTGGRYDPAADRWVAMATLRAPSPRTAHAAVWTGREMIVWGGLECTPGCTTAGLVSTGGRYDPVADRWTAMATDRAPVARAGHTALWTGREMIVWGGVGAAASLATGGRYDPAADRWAATALVKAPSARSQHTAVWTGREMIVWGGLGEAFPFLETGGRYEPAADRWVATPSANGPAGRVGHTAVWTGSEMIVWGGTPDGGNPFTTDDRGGRYNPSTNDWVATALTSAPPGRAGHSAVWTGSEMIVWGGSYFNTGGRYRPATDSWMATATAGAPSGRQGHTAVWTGREMIVWGGEAPGGPAGSGARYDPAADRWLATTAVAAPDGRSGHTAVWTGSEMIVWGGTPQAGGLDTGGRYDPAADHWMATTTRQAPAARFGHAAVWTGSEMLVWGGADLASDCSVTAFDTGGRYLPATDRWLPMPTAGAPSGRYGHSAVWTGSEMIVWGGSDNADGFVDPLGTGGRYRPITDTWTTTEAAAAPSGRLSHTAIWTGSEMIVWGGTGGADGSVFLSSGGRYLPTVDRWLPTTRYGAPTARSLHTALWTGEVMIVWGGSRAQFFGLLGDGGLYRPPPL